MRRRSLLIAVAAVAAAPAAFAQSDPLPSWNDGAANTTGATAIALNLGTVGKKDGLTQSASNSDTPDISNVRTKADMQLTIGAESSARKDFSDRRHSVA